MKYFRQIILFFSVIFLLFFIGIGISHVNNMKFTQEIKYSLDNNSDGIVKSILKDYGEYKYNSNPNIYKDMSLLQEVNLSNMLYNQKTPEDRLSFMLRHYMFGIHLDCPKYVDGFSIYPEFNNMLYRLFFVINSDIYDDNMGNAITN